MAVEPSVSKSNYERQFFSGLEEGQACGCDWTENCLGECRPCLECSFEDVSFGHEICTKRESYLQITEIFVVKH